MGALRATDQTRAKKLGIPPAENVCVFGPNAKLQATAMDATEKHYYYHERFKKARRQAEKTRRRHGSKRIRTHTASILARLTHASHDDALALRMIALCYVTRWFIRSPHRQL